MTNFIAIMSQELFKNITKILDPARCVTTNIAMRIAKSKTDFQLILEASFLHQWYLLLMSVHRHAELRTLQRAS